MGPLAEVLVVCVEHTTWKATAGGVLVIISEPGDKRRRQSLSGFNFGGCNFNEIYHFMMSGLEHFLSFRDLGLVRPEEQL